MIGYYKKETIEHEFKEKLSKALLWLGVQSIANALKKVLNAEQVKQLTEYLNNGKEKIS